MTELNQILTSRSDDSSILLVYTDDGPYHRLTYALVQISLISLCLERDLDFLCAVRTPPHNSWKNPVERIMLIINIALQSVGIMRGCTQSFENQLKGCKNLASIRQCSVQNPGLEDEVINAIEAVKSLLYTLFVQLKLKERNFSTFMAASNEDVYELFCKIHHIDNTLTQDDTTQKSLALKANFQKFLETHCKSRHYRLCVKKCGATTCEWCNKPQLPQKVFSTLSHLPDPIPRANTTRNLILFMALKQMRDSNLPWWSQRRKAMTCLFHHQHSLPRMLEW